MEKIVINAECLTINVNAKGSNASFVVKSDKQPAAMPGQPQRIAARRAIQFNFDDATAKNFEPGSIYSIAVEDAAE